MMSLDSAARLFRLLGCAASVVFVLGHGQAGCAAGSTDQILDDEDDGAVAAGVGGQMTGSGGAGGAKATGGGAVGGSAQLPCGIDCSTIDAGDCKQAVCDTRTKKCVIEALPEGTVCDDGAFCTTLDTCQAGECVGGPPNDCGLTVPACQQVICNEASDSCALAPGLEGQPCSSNNLCLVNATCQSGLCQGGQPKDCFFAPVPDECHVAECEPSSGLCVPVPGNDGQPCTDQNDLCVTGKSCQLGVCVGGSPKDCSALSVGCSVGTCDAQSGMCVGLPAGEGNPCDDKDPCTNGETCQSGQCTGGMTTTACVDNDQCCPMACDENNDVDCKLTTCKSVAGILWCYHPTECGKPCNETCAFFGKTPMADKTQWLNAQNTTTKCQAIATAFGINGVSIASYTYACMEDSAGTHTPGVLKGPLLCSSFSGCPNNHLTNMDQKGQPCTGQSRISICPCE